MAINGNIKIKIMINGNKNKTESFYRNIKLDSYSSIKTFAQDRKKYYKLFFLHEEVKEDETAASVIGRVVDCLLFEPELFDDRFYLSACANSPTGLMLEFVEALYTHTKASTNEDGEVDKSFEELSRAAYTDSGFKIKYEAVIQKFIGSDAEIYYNEIRNVRTKGLTVITANDVANAERIVEELKNNSVTSGILNLVDSDRYTVLKQFKIEGFEIDGFPLKSMIDLVIIDHKEKIIQIFDLKCVWAVENFLDEYYLYRRAYLQAYIYWRAILNSEDIFSFDHSDYEVLYPKFIVCDSINYYNPLIYTLNEQDMTDAYEGFEYKGRQYIGLKEIIEDLKFALAENVWNMSRKNYLSNGVVKLRG